MIKQILEYIVVFIAVYLFIGSVLGLLLKKRFERAIEKAYETLDPDTEEFADSLHLRGRGKELLFILFWPILMIGFIKNNLKRNSKE